MNFRIVLAAFFALLFVDSSPALAQAGCGGQAAPGQICANNRGSRGLPEFTSHLGPNLSIDGPLTFNGSLGAISFNGSLGSIQIATTGNVLSFGRNGDNYISANAGSSSAIHLQANGANIVDIAAASLQSNVATRVVIPAGTSNGLSVLMNPTGTSAGGNCPPGMPGASYCPNVIALGVSGIDNISVADGQAVQALVIYDQFGQGIGGHQALWVFAQLSQATSALNVSNRNYVSANFTMNAASGDGGTSPTVPGAQGGVFGIGIQVSSTASATNLLEVAGAEVNLQVGSSPWYKAYMTFAGAGGDNAKGNVIDAALVFARGAGSVGTRNPILFCDCNGATMVDNTTVLMAGQTVLAAAPWTILGGIDLSQFAPTSFAFKSNGFLVDPSGNVTAPTVTASLTGHASLDCALSGCTMSGNIAMGSHAISGVTNLTASGAVTVNGTNAGITLEGTFASFIIGDTTNTTTNPNFVMMKGASGGANLISGQTVVGGSNKTRWQIQLGNGTAESGANAGSDFSLAAYNDAGTFLNAPINVTRSNGNVSFAADVNALTYHANSVAGVTCGAGLGASSRVTAGIVTTC